MNNLHIINFEAQDGQKQAVYFEQKGKLVEASPDCSTMSFGEKICASFAEALVEFLNYWKKQFPKNPIVSADSQGDQLFRIADQRKALEEEFEDIELLLDGTPA